MNAKKYKWILYAITFVILCTIGIQVYWNYKNYLSNKQQLVNDVQTSLDKAVDDYYTNLAQQTTIALSINGDHQKDVLKDGGLLDRLTKKIDEHDSFIGIDSLRMENIEGIAVFRGLEADSMMRDHNAKNKPISIDSLKNRLKDSDLKFPPDFEMLTSKIMISIDNDSLALKDVDSLLKIELNRKQIDVDYSLKFKDHQHRTEHFGVIELVDSTNHDHYNGQFLQTWSSSAFLPRDSELSISFTNETKVVLRRILSGILISTLLVLAVISCLFYLLKIINNQKQLAEVKNDLISNITHEFKTPIATIGAALEGINNFNIIEDKEKTRKYVDMSTHQLSKLNVMVEKLLETATLDSDNLKLKKEQIDLIELLTVIVNKFQMQEPNKTFDTSFKVEDCPINVDTFHFENAINNILDNAIKYGGDLITVDVTPKEKHVEISISDNGNNLTKDHKEKIFEKFYRVPKGNTHDVKGFGIGLFYTKTIVEKHNGHVTIDLNNQLTTFKISIPNG